MNLVPRDKIEYRPDIDGLRAISVLAVVGFHAAPLTFRGGFIGVDIFFVISGYLISQFIFSGLEIGSFSFIDFYARRVRRIFPALIIILICVWAFGWFRLLPLDFSRLGRDVAAGVGYVSNIVFWNDAGYFDKSSIEKPLLHLWSLGVEEQFYLLFPLIVFVVWKLRLPIALVIFTIGTASFVCNVWTVIHHPVAAFFLPQCRFWELMLGSGLAYHSLFGKQATLNPLFSNAASVTGVSAILAGVFYLDPARHFPGWWALVPTIGAVLVIAAGKSAWSNRFFLSNRIAVGLGLISYPLYLWHWPLLSFATISEGQQILSGKTTVAMVSLAVILASATYWLVERPIRFKRLPLNPMTSAALLIAVSALLILPLGLYTFLGDGFSSRFPPMLTWTGADNAATMAAYRANQCFISPSSNPVFATECIEKPTHGEPEVVLWGDSHAAALYPGLRELQRAGGFSLSQFTTSSCAPLLNVSQDFVPHCKTINDDVFKKIETLRPDMVILSAQWYVLPSAKIDLHTLGYTIKMLRDSGVRNVLVVGPVPVWRFGLPSRLQQVYLATREVPFRTTNGVQLSADLDAELEGIAKESDASYLSAIRFFCGADGCLARNGGEIFVWDSSHLTVSGSKYFIGKAFADSKIKIPTAGGAKALDRLH